MTVMFRDRIERKPSVAIRAMVQGLREMNTWPDMEVNMSTYFRADTRPGDDGSTVKICCACAATAAIMKLGNTRFHPDMQLRGCSDIDDRVRALDACGYDYSEFEDVMNALRAGFPYDLFEYCDLECIGPDGPLPCMESHNWEESLPYYEEYAEQLEKLGL